MIELDATTGAALRRAGLTPRALAAWAGTDRLSALRTRIAGLAAPREVTPAAAVLVLLVAGGSLPRAALRIMSNATLDALERAGLVERVGDELRARVAVLPLGGSLIVCDRADAPPDLELACWPDDSSYHLAHAIPAPVERWLDLGCGSGFAALLRPNLATWRGGAELSARTAHYAALGAALSGVALDVVVSDLDREVPPAWRGACELVTCNAPIPGDAAVAHWRHAGPGFFPRLWAAARALLAPGGTVVVHGALEPLLDPDLEGELVTLAYTPGGLPSQTGFGVTWWRPDAPTRRIAGSRLLDAARPHLEARDHVDALAGLLT